MRREGRGEGWEGWSRRGGGTGGLCCAGLLTTLAKFEHDNFGARFENEAAHPLGTFRGNMDRSWPITVESLYLHSRRGQKKRRGSSKCYLYRNAKGD